MKINIPKEMQKRETLGDALESNSFEALSPKIDDAYNYVSDCALKMALMGHYGLSIKHEDIALHIEITTDAPFHWIVKHVEALLIEEGIQVVDAVDNECLLSICWGIGKWPEGTKTMAIRSVRG